MNELNGNQLTLFFNKLEGIRALLHYIDTPTLITDQQANIYYYNLAIQSLFPSVENQIFLERLNEMASFLYNHFDGIQWERKNEENYLALHKTKFKSLNNLKDYHCYGFKTRFENRTFFVFCFRRKTCVTRLKHQLESVEQEFQTLLYKSSHNLRGPLTSIRGIVNLIRTECKELVVLQYLPLLEKLTDRMDQILQELYINANIRKSSFTQVRGIKLNLLWQKVIKFLAQSPDFKNIVILYEADKNIRLFVKAQLLFVILKNLICNSIQHRHPERSPVIKVSFSHNEKGIYININDNGKGIPKDLSRKVFEMFFKGNDSVKGEGLGLYTVRNAVHRLNGSIQLKSKMGEGTNIRIFLPKQIH